MPIKKDDENINIKFILNLLIIISMAVGAIIWATGEHSVIREWTSEQDFVTKTELKEIIKEQYVKRSEFIQLRTQFEETNKNNQKIITELDKIQGKIDQLKKRRR